MNPTNPIIDTIAEYFTQRSEVVAVYLFGSFAKAKEKLFSDIDIAVLIDFDRLEKFEQEYQFHLGKLSRMTRKDIDLVIMNTAGEELLNQIYITGHTIAINDYQKLSFFNMTAHSKIADFAYSRKIMQDAVIRSIFTEA